MSSGKEGDQEQVHHSVQMEGLATLGKRNFPSITNSPTKFPWDRHNDFQHNEELGPMPLSYCLISIWLPVRLQIPSFKFYRKAKKK